MQVKTFKSKAVLLICYHNPPNRSTGSSANKYTEPIKVSSKHDVYSRYVNWNILNLCRIHTFRVATSQVYWEATRQEVYRTVFHRVSKVLEG